MKQAIIPAAGTGSRFGYLSKVLPKCLFPLYDRPILAHILRHLNDLRVEEVFIIVGYKKEKIMEFVNEVKHDFEFKVKFIEQKEPRGVADAVNLTRENIRGDFIVILGDDVTFTKSLSNLIDVFHGTTAVIVEGIVKETNLDKLRSACCLTINSNKAIRKIVEKPATPFSDIRGCGIYVCSKELFDYISKTPLSKSGQLDITETISMLAKDERAYAEFINGINLNVNSYDDLLVAWQTQKVLGDYLNA